MNLLRGLLGATGLALAAWGAWLLLDGAALADLVEVAVWFTVGVLVHDAVLAPLVLLLGYVVVRRLPAAARAPFVVAGLLLGTVTLAVLPTLGRFAAKPDDPYLLNRPYLAWWLLLAAVLAVAAGVATRVRAGRGRPGRGPA